MSAPLTSYKIIYALPMLTIKEDKGTISGSLLCLCAWIWGKCVTAGELFNSNHIKADVFIPSVFQGQGSVYSSPY